MFTLEVVSEAIAENISKQLDDAYTKYSHFPTTINYESEFKTLEIDMAEYLYVKVICNMSFINIIISVITVDFAALEYDHELEEGILSRRLNWF